MSKWGELTIGNDPWEKYEEPCFHVEVNRVDGFIYCAKCKELLGEDNGLE